MTNVEYLLSKPQKIVAILFCGALLSASPENLMAAGAGQSKSAKSAPVKAPAVKAPPVRTTPAPNAGVRPTGAAPGMAGRPSATATKPGSSVPGRAPDSAGSQPGVGNRPVGQGQPGQRPGSTLGAQPNRPGGVGSAATPARSGPVTVAKTTPLSNGRREEVRTDGSKRTLGTDHHVQSFESGDHTTHVSYGKGGRPESVTRVKPGGVVETTHRMPNGQLVSRTVMPDRSGHGEMRIESRGRIGRVERPIMGRPGFYRHSYYEHGGSYARVYRGYRYRGYDYYRPVPAYIYSPGFYAWGFQPWGPNIAYGWGWQAQPWYGVYGTAFTPYQTYAGLDQWMTDYVIATNLRLAYEAGQGVQQQVSSAGPGSGANGDAGGTYADSGPPPITPEMKDEIAAQVKLEMEEQQQAATKGVAGVAGPPPPPPGAADAPAPEDMPDALKPGHTLFRVVSPVNAEVAGQPCSLTADDYIARTSDLKAPPGTVTVTVKASRAADCPNGAAVEIALNDLMVMEGDQQQRIMDGYKVAADNMGKNGLPTGPSSGATAVPLGQAVPDSGLAETLKQQQTEADTDQQQAIASAGPAQ